MEPLAHTLLGASLGQLAARPAIENGGEGPRRSEPGLVLAGIVAANVPDVDALAYAVGSDFALGFRRGLTHGAVAMLVWPVILTALFAAWRGRHGAAPGGRVGARLAAVVVLGCWSHPLLDWLNNYGIRLLMPFDGRWFYGDVAFIVDPWMWLLLGGGLVLARSPGPRERRRWAVLGALCAFAVGVSPTPLWARVAWLTALVGLAVTVHRRFAAGVARSPASVPRLPATAPVAVGLALFVLYVGALAGVQRAARHRVSEALPRAVGSSAAGPGGLMVGPRAMDPLHWQVVSRGEDGYVVGSFRWTAGLGPIRRLPAVEASSGAPLSEVVPAWSSPEAAGFARWVRFPFHREVEEPAGRFVYLLDARYTTEPTTVFGGVRVPASRPEE